MPTLLTKKAGMTPMKVLVMLLECWKHQVPSFVYVLSLCFVYVWYLLHIDGVADHTSKLYTTSGEYFTRVLSLNNYLVYCMVGEDGDISNFPFARQNRGCLSFVFVLFTVQNQKLNTMCTRCNSPDQHRSRVLDIMWKPKELLRLSEEQMNAIRSYLDPLCSKQCLHAKAIQKVRLLSPLFFETTVPLYFPSLVRSSS
jgi:hypothetical protein